MTAVSTVADKIDFQADHHTYRYQLRDGTLASSRLDRWYVSNAFSQRIATVRVDPPVNFSDHDAVSIAFAVTSPRIASSRRRRPRLRYPLPFGCRSAITELMTALVDKFDEDCAGQGGAWTADAWVKMKANVRREALCCVRVNLRRQRRGLRQRRKRLSSALRTALYAAGPSSQPQGADIASITAGIADLAISPFDRIAGLRQAIIRLDRRRARSRRRATLARYAGETPEAERAFFQRFNARQGQRYAAALPSESSAGRATADRLADDWSAITQMGATDAAARDEFFCQLPAITTSPLLASMDDAFTEDEVRAALKACPRGKAPGPDGLPNDWYRDHEDLLVPVLTPLYNQWHRQRTLPASFRLATVACIPKTSTPKTGLDFRPIALLGTDYKIYSRLLLSRVGPVLPVLVAPTQFGFVPGRQVHDALDVFDGLQTLIRSGQAPASTVAILLDFAKAYDTLDRAFLLRALERLGFPSGFRAAVEQMHLHTTAEYAADAGISAPQPVLNGIRHGCPLAPTLFVLAVNTLYEAIDCKADIEGIELPNGEQVCATGYADDTTCYLASAASARPLRLVLDQFGDAAGLRINLSKCVAVHLGEQRCDVEAFPTAAPDDASRLLGGYVATNSVSGKVWTITMQQIRARLHWAELKTTNETQRVKLIRAVFLPKFLFVARHQWPTATIVDKFQRLVDGFVWSGSLAATGPRKRAWVSQPVARARIAEGGLDVPHLTHELQILSLTTVEQWARPHSGMQAAIGHVLLQHRLRADGFLAPSRGQAVSRPTLRPSLAATGTQLRQALATTPRFAEEYDLLQPLLSQVGRGTSADYGWERGWLMASYLRVEPQLTALRRFQFGKYGNLQVDVLLRARVVGDDILCAASGSPVTTSDFPGLIRPTDRIRDIVELAWSDSGTLNFRCMRHEWPLASALSTTFRRFCDTLVFNYPGILRPPAQPEDLILRPPSLDVICGWLHRHSSWCAATPRWSPATSV